MDSTDLFYMLKPVIPRRIQIMARHLFAISKKKKNSKVWPINIKAGDIPINWREWPEKKKFAFILIHDVDTKDGLKKWRNLAELEIGLGFRSSFNFVPEGYSIPKEVREELAKLGFELGVHGLTHNARIFRKYDNFRAKQHLINRYLEEWQSVGFTSPSMLSNLRWVADLNIEYGCSSFDTDPFEPRPYGVATIFPFIVSDMRNSRSYVELPYTLPQDHSLFIILREKTIETWKRKLSFIAERGGLALLNTHPDYMNFDGSPCSYKEYPSAYYHEFLEYVRTQYKDQYWHVLPREFSKYWKSTYPNDAIYSYEGTNITAANRVAVYSKRMKYERKIKLALTCAAGGHFEQMQNLEPLYKNYPHFWITDKTTQTEYSLSGEKGHFIKGAHFKKPWTYLVQVPRVFRILKKEQPTHMLSTGSGIIVFIPFIVSRVLKIKFIHIETFSHVNKLTKMGKMLHKLNQEILSQWDSIRVKNVRSIGTVLSDKTSNICDEQDESSVFVTLGTRVHPFQRLVATVEMAIKNSAIKERVIIQLGHTKYESPHMESFSFCAPEKIDDYICASKYVVTQESAGIVTKCLKLNKRFIVMPRDYANKELPAKSDMNEDLHYKLEEMGYTYVVHDQAQLESAIKKIDKLKTGYRFDNSLAIAELKKLIENHY